MPAHAVVARLSGSYPVEEVDALISDLQPLLELDAEAKVFLDLRDLEMLHPSTSAVLAALLERCSRHEFYGPTSEVRPPQRPAVRNAVARLHGYQGLLAASGVTGSAGRVGSRVSQFEDEAGARMVSRELTEALAAGCDVDDLAIRAIRTCLDELCDNVIHHAESDLGGFASGRGWRRPPRFEVALADLGIGVRRSLNKNPSYADVDDDVAALKRAVELGVTSTPDRNSGYGLPVTRDLLDANGGLLVIKSGWAELALGSEDEVFKSDAEFPGTLVVLRARTNRPLNVTDVYRRLLGNMEDD